MTKKILMMRGLPGSGKSTIAKHLVEKEKYKRVNKDDLRSMLDNGKWSKKSERLVNEIQDAIVDLCLIYGNNVVIDNSNFEFKHIDRAYELAEMNAAEVEIYDVDTDIETCIERDLKRPNSVGEQVIRGMYQRYLGCKPPEHIDGKPSALIVDIDGTLATMKDRGPYDWGLVGNDDLNENIAELLVKYRDDDTHILLVSGRDGICFDQTVEWLRKYGVPYDKLFMRDAGDNRKDVIVKQELYQDNILGRYNVKFVLDDRMQVVQMWRMLGLPCYQVQNGDF